MLLTLNLDDNDDDDDGENDEDKRSVFTPMMIVEITKAINDD